MSENYEEAKELYQQKTEYDQETPLIQTFNQLAAVHTHYLSKNQLKKIKDSEIPIWICTGTDDKLVKPQNSLYLMDILKPIKSTIFSGVGHCVNLEVANQFNEELLKFLESAINLTEHC